ncbi:hypothetical protein Ciccas_006897 [Cichlidogyrus casuarinus]|uniref:ADP-ribosylation factor-binding protein GGA1 n=1 Tax=Cichlidogyrus casuarinus TaxID=1844966 RepID=A0ABD2Q4I3_9PLAT
MNTSYSLVSLTNPLSDHLSNDEVCKLSKEIQSKIDGPQKALQLLAHKIQSPQSREALNALMVLESCLQSADHRFLSEFGKFKFLNEIIKVLSPKYLGDKTPEPVKQRCKELILSWKRQFGDKEHKINQVYDLLHDLGIFTDADNVEPNCGKPAEDCRTPPKSMLDITSKSIEFLKLVKSKNPEDIKRANQMIQDAVNKDIEKKDRRSKHQSQLELVRTNATLLAEILNNVKESQDEELMSELVESLKKALPSLNEIANSEYDDETDQYMLSEFDSWLSMILLSADVIDVCDLANSALDKYETRSQSHTLVCIIDAPQTEASSVLPVPTAGTLTVDDLLSSDTSKDLLSISPDTVLCGQQSYLENGCSSTSVDWESLRNLTVTSVFDTAPLPNSTRDVVKESALKDLDELGKMMLDSMKQETKDQAATVPEIDCDLTFNHLEVSLDEIKPADSEPTQLHVYRDSVLTAVLHKTANRIPIDCNAQVVSFLKYNIDSGDRDGGRDH